MTCLKSLAGEQGASAYLLSSDSTECSFLLLGGQVTVSACLPDLSLFWLLWKKVEEVYGCVCVCVCVCVLNGVETGILSNPMDFGVHGMALGMMYCSIKAHDSLYFSTISYVMMKYGVCG